MYASFEIMHPYKLNKIVNTLQTKIRGILSLLKSSRVLSTDQDKTPVVLLLSPVVKTFLDLRRKHDDYLMEQIIESEFAFSYPTQVSSIWTFFKLFISNPLLVYDNATLLGDDDSGMILFGNRPMKYLLHLATKLYRPLS
jgi:hypothetical protein